MSKILSSLIMKSLLNVLTYVTSQSHALWHCSFHSRILHVFTFPRCSGMLTQALNQTVQPHTSWSLWGLCTCQTALVTMPPVTSCVRFLLSSAATSQHTGTALQHCESAQVMHTALTHPLFLLWTTGSTSQHILPRPCPTAIAKFTTAEWELLGKRVADTDIEICQFCQDKCYFLQDTC